MRFRGRVFKFGDNVDTDVIIPAKYLVTSDPIELAKGCMEPLKPTFYKEVKSGDIIFAGKNFGCGSSREHAPVAIKGCGISCVVAESFARIFYRNSYNIGFPAIVCPEAVSKTHEGDEVEILFEEGVIRNITREKKFKFSKPPDFMLKLIELGGLMKLVDEYK
jgi:3-isopropylmalate/(R)-2-methylmalate dehydratase small subunit